MYFDDPMPSSMEKGTNEVKIDDDSDCSHDNDSEEEMPDDSDDDTVDMMEVIIIVTEDTKGKYRRRNMVAFSSLNAYCFSSWSWLIDKLVSNLS